MQRPNKKHRVPWVTVQDLEFDDLATEPEEVEPPPTSPAFVYQNKYVVQNTTGQGGPSFFFAEDLQAAQQAGRRLGYGGIFSGGMLVTWLGRFRCPVES